MKVKHCYTNVERCVYLSRQQLEAVNCWILNGAEEVRQMYRYCESMGTSTKAYPIPTRLDFEAEFHCILRNKKTGKLLDVTPDANPNRKTRMIVLETRMTPEYFRGFKFKTPESVVRPEWAKRTPVPDKMPDFFEQLDRLKRILIVVWCSVIWDGIQKM